MKTITEQQRMTLLGIHAMAENLNREGERLEKMAMEIVGEDERHGHCSDFIWGGVSVERLLQNMKVEVSETAGTSAQPQTETE